MLKSKKKFLVPVMVMILLVAMTGNALAGIYDDGYDDMWWHTGTGQLGVNSTSSHDSNETRLIQTVLNDADNAGLTIDGDYGPNTRNAVISYQNTNVYLASDGIVGDDYNYSNTWYYFQQDLYGKQLGYSSYSNRWYYSYWAKDSNHRNYRHYDDGKWYVLVNGSWYHVN